MTRFILVSEFPAISKTTIKHNPVTLFVEDYIWKRYSLSHSDLQGICTSQTRFRVQCSSFPSFISIQLCLYYSLKQGSDSTQFLTQNTFCPVQWISPHHPLAARLASSQLKKKTKTPSVPTQLWPSKLETKRGLHCTTNHDEHRSSQSPAGGESSRRGEFSLGSDRRASLLFYWCFLSNVRHDIIQKSLNLPLIHRWT